MTRKKALLTAISALDRVDAEDVSEVKLKLQELLDDLPVTKWNKQAILDAIEQYRQDRGRYPTLKELDNKGLPTRRIIEKTFGQLAEEVLLSFFPDIQLRRRVVKR